ncbi:MAG: hypothetical protein WBD47_04905 [Phormidesmis sp.]
MIEPDPFKQSQKQSQQQCQEIEALRQAMMRSWWWVCLALWLSVGLLSLWWLRLELQELMAYFTWSAVRYMLYYERLAAMGIGLCFGLTLALLWSESRHILWGLSESEKSRLVKQLNKIHEQGPTHPQWKIICPPPVHLKE